MEALYRQLSNIRVPIDSQSIYKDECMYSFDNPETSTGLYVSMTSFLGFGEEYVQAYADYSENYVFLHIYREKHLKSDGTSDTDKAGPVRKLTRLAIGIEGGYNNDDTKNYEYKNHYSIVVMPDISNKLPFPSKEFPLIVTESVEAILSQDSAISKLEKKMLSGTWDGEVRHVSVYSDHLKQKSNGKVIPPSGWKCEECDLTKNLWLNLTDGSILCGRRFFDGSGGNNHAIEHYRKHGYPLAVKLGTKSDDGKPDVYSYPEDDMVIDLKLEEHLAHFGLRMADMTKSEKSMIELEIEINQRIGEWSLLTESESELQPLSGPGYTGMRNLGNSCYINSVMQVLFSLPDFISRFVGEGAESYFNRFPKDPANDFNIQMSKLGNGLWSGKYSSITENSLDATGISPTMFRNLVGKKHGDFGSKQQQDAYDFLLHLIGILESNSFNESKNPIEAFAFKIEDRVECSFSKKVRYTSREDYCLSLPIPLEKATNLDELKEYLEKKANNPPANNNFKDVVRQKVPLDACLEGIFGEDIIEEFYSPEINTKGTAKVNTGLINMPDYLMMHMRKFAMGKDGQPKKLDVEIEMPDDLDMSKWRSHGKQPGEVDLISTPDPKFIYDETIISSLMDMGFPPNACKKAAFYTKNSGVEMASNWLMEHIGDADFCEPFVIPTNDTSFIPDPESLAYITSMGFDQGQAIKALKATGGNLERATEWMINSGDINVSEPRQVTKKRYRDGSGKYKLFAFISHMGTSAQVGHYVCHIKKDGQWVIFNDSKVALSQNPPKNLGYLYVYKREE